MEVHNLARLDGQVAVRGEHWSPLLELAFSYDLGRKMMNNWVEVNIRISG